MIEPLTYKKKPVSSVRLKSLALPTEHGGWGFLLEPILLGLLTVPTWAGLALSIAALGVFLLTQPAKIVLKDWQKGLYVPRTRWALRFAALYAGMALLMLVIALALSPHAFWLPLLLASPFALFQLYAASQNRGRALLPELVGAVALGATVAAIVLAGGGMAANAFALWLILSLRSVPSILYVRTRLRLERGDDINRRQVIVAHGVALLISVILVVAGNAHVLTVFAFVLLLVRAVRGLSAWRNAVPAKIIGMWEMIYGFSVVVLVAIGAHWMWR